MVRGNTLTHKSFQALGQTLYLQEAKGHTLSLVETARIAIIAIDWLCIPFWQQC